MAKDAKFNRTETSEKAARAVSEDEARTQLLQVAELLVRLVKISGPSAGITGYQVKSELAGDPRQEHNVWTARLNALRKDHEVLCHRFPDGTQVFDSANIKGLLTRVEPTGRKQALFFLADAYLGDPDSVLADLRSGKTVKGTRRNRADMKELIAALKVWRKYGAPPTKCQFKHILLALGDR